MERCLRFIVFFFPNKVVIKSERVFCFML
jgi:hypothetical protein